MTTLPTSGSAKEPSKEAVNGISAYSQLVRLLAYELYVSPTVSPAFKGKPLLTLAALIQADIDRIIDRTCAEKDKEIAELNGCLDGVCADAVKRSSEKDDLLLQVLTTRQQLAERDAQVVELLGWIKGCSVPIDGLGFETKAGKLLAKTAASYSGLTTIKVEELAELLKDRERLDWFDKKEPVLHYTDAKWNLDWEIGWGNKRASGVSLRAAIDAAMRTTAGNGRAEG